MSNFNQKSKLLGIIIAAFFFSLCFLTTKLSLPKTVQSAGLTNVSATLSNPRLSYRAGVGATGAVGASFITIGSTAAGAHGDISTNHLFPNDYVCFSDGGTDLNERGCKGNTNYKVNRINGLDTFLISSGLTALINGNQLVVATQSGTMNIALTIGSSVPANGTILVTIPAVNSDTNTADGIPDEASSTSTNGFDLNAITAQSAVSVTGGNGCTWSTTKSITPGTSTTDHLIVVTTTTQCTSGTINITVGNTSAAANMLVNPAPISTGHTAGVSDIYTINIKTRNTDGSEIESANIRVAPVEGVLVSATVEETLTFKVEGIGSGTAACGNNSNITTTSTAIPWGTINGGQSYSAAQKLTMTTNSPNGYAVTVEENDQMGKDGVTCTGDTAGETNNCIQDTTCAASACSESTAGNWTVGVNYPGLGYSLENISSGSPAVWYYNQPAYGNCGGSPTFCAKQLADIEATETKQTIMTKATPQSSNQINVCYRLAITGTQPAGYYYNKVKYTATATF